MKEKALHCTISLRIFRDEKFFGPGVAQLLEAVGEASSLRAAALKMDMSYSKAWSIIKRAEAQFGFKLLESSTGGKGGGGASLTPQAEELLCVYRRFEQESKAAVDELFSRHFCKYQP